MGNKPLLLRNSYLQMPLKRYVRPGVFELRTEIEVAAVTTLFEKKARLLSIGDLMGVSETNFAPTPIYAGGDIHAVPDAKTMAGFLFVYRGRLLKSGYRNTEFDALWKVSRSDDAVTLGIRWRHVDKFSREISRLEGTYYCKNTSLGWRAVLIDFGQSVDTMLPRRQDIMPDQQSV